MGIFDSIQEEIEAREKREGISPADLLDFSPPVRQVMNRITRGGEQTAADVAQSVERPIDEVRQMLNGLAEKGYLEREKRDKVWIYRTRFARRRRRTIPGGIWSALGQLADEEGEPDT
jgi:DNA-binding IclR family transcriptional regulator